MAKHRVFKLIVIGSLVMIPHDGSACMQVVNPSHMGISYFITILSFLPYFTCTILARLGVYKWRISDRVIFLLGCAIAFLTFALFNVTFVLLDLGFAYDYSDLRTTLLGSLVDIRIILVIFGIYVLKGINREDPRNVRSGRFASVILSFSAIIFLSLEALPVKLVVNFSELQSSYEDGFRKVMEPDNVRSSIYNELDKAVK